MRYRTLTSILTAAALVCAPTAGFAQSAPQPASSQEAGLALSEGADQDDDDDDLVWYILGGVTVVVLAILLLLDDDDDDEELPVSP